VSRCAFVGYCVGFSYVVLSFIFFTTCFAVQPDMEKPYTMTIHTVPYTNLMIALWVMAVMVTKFGDQVAWKGMGLPCWFSNTNYVMIFIQSVCMVGKVLHHINCLGNLNGGLWWDPHTNGAVKGFFNLLDWLFDVAVLLYPTFQSAYLSRARYKTDCVFMSLEDNRKSAICDPESDKL